MELTWAGTRLVQADPFARRAMAAGTGSDDLERLLSGLGVHDASVAEGLRRSLISGRAYDAASTRLCGGEVAAVAYPDGRRVAMTLRLSGPPQHAPESRTLLSAAESAEQPIWLRGGAGRALWRNRACEASGFDLDDPRLRSAAATATATRAAQSLRVTCADDQVFTATESPGGMGFAVPVLAEQPKSPSGTEAASAALNQLNSGVAVFGTGRRLLYANRAFRDFWTLRPDLLDDGPRIEILLDKMRDSGRLPSVANYPMWREEVAEWADPLAEAPSEDDWHLSDGAVIRIERSTDDAARTFFSFHDITAQIALERRFRRVVSVQRRTLDALDGGVALLDPNGRLRLANPAFAELWTLDSAQVRIGAHIAEIPAPSAIGAAAEAWAELRLTVTGGAGRAERRFRLGGRVLHSVAAPMPDGSTLARIDDRTAAAQAEMALRERGEALESAAELRAALADCASVKLRTSLTSISGFAELMAMDCESAERRAQLDAILTATADMAKAIEEIEELASERPPDSAEFLPAADLLSMTGGLLSRALWTAEARLEMVNEGGGSVFIGDTDSFRQIALAMSLAALDGLPPGGVLRLTARRADPDEEGRLAAILSAETTGPPGRPAPGERLARAFVLAERIGASLTVTEEDGRRAIALTSAAAQAPRGR